MQYLIFALSRVFKFLLYVGDIHCGSYLLLEVCYMSNMEQLVTTRHKVKVGTGDECLHTLISEGFNGPLC